MPPVIDPLAHFTIQRIRARGWKVSVFHLNGTVEMHAVKLPEGEPAHVARCNDGDAAEHEREAAVLLSRAVGLDDSA